MKNIKIIGLMLTVFLTGCQEGMSNSEEKPPVFKSWKGWYITLIGVLSVLILLFYLFTNHFS